MYTHDNLLKEPTDFQNFPRLDGILLRMVKPEIEKRDPAMRDVIPLS